MYNKATRVVSVLIAGGAASFAGYKAYHSPKAGEVWVSVSIYAKTTAFPLLKERVVPLFYTNHQITRLSLGIVAGIATLAAVAAYIALRSIRRELRAAQAQNVQLQEQVTEQPAAVEAVRTELQRRLDEQTVQRDAIQHDLQVAQQSFVELQQTYDRELPAARQVLREREAVFTQQASALQEMRAQLATIQAELETAQARIQAHPAEIAALNQQIEHAQQGRDAAETSLQQSRLDITRLEQDLTATRTNEVHVNIMRLKTLEEENKRLAGAQDSASKIAPALHKQIDSQKTTIQQLTADNASLRQRLHAQSQVGAPLKAPEQPRAPMAAVAQRVRHPENPSTRSYEMLPTAPGTNVQAMTQMFSVGTSQRPQPGFRTPPRGTRTRPLTLSGRKPKSLPKTPSKDEDPK